MKRFRQLFSSRQNLLLSSNKFFGGLVLTSLLSLFLSLFSNSSTSADFSLNTCDNVTSGGSIGENQSQCAAFDPDMIFNITSPSGGSGDIQYLWLQTTDCTLPVNQWDQISGANGASYDPGLISQTTCFIRCSRRVGCSDWDGETNIVTIEVSNNCPDEDWEFSCDEGKTVELVGKGIKNNVPVTLDFNNSTNIYQVVIEIVYKGGNPGNSISVFDEFGIPYIAYREQPVGGSSSVYVYRTILPATSSVSYQNQSQESKAQSIVAYLFRNVASANQSAGYFTHISGYHDVQNLTFTIPAEDALRDIYIELPVSEMTPDCRILNITATAGTVSEMLTIDGPDDDLGCCLNIVPITLNNVPGDITELEIEIASPTGNGSGCPSTPDHNGQSYVIAGAVKIDVECVCPLAEINILDQDHCVDNPSVFLAENVGDQYDYFWDFGTNAQPQTAFGIGPHFVSYSTAGTQTISLSVNNDTCSTVSVLESINVEDCNNTQCGLVSVSVASNSDCYEATGTLTVDVCETCGTVYPINVFYTFNGLAQQAGPFDNDGDILTDLPAGIYTDIYIQDANGCTSNHAGPVVIESTGDAGTVSTETCGSTLCTITGYHGNEGPSAFWIPGLSDVTNVRYNFDVNNGSLEVFENGTARFMGRITNLDDPSCGFEVDLLFANKRNWSSWSALGHSWKGNPVIVGTLYETWDYYEIQDGSTLTGFGCFSGTLNISHQPADHNFGVQIGQAANAKNELPGISAWFFYDGVLNGQNVSGSGDINAEGACGSGIPGEGSDPETPILSCPPCISLDCNSSLDPTENDEIEIPYVNCSDSFTLSYADAQAGACPIIVTRTWTATGPGGTASCAQEITLLDSIAPIILNVPADITVECDAIPAAVSPTATDNCDTNVEIVFNEAQTDGDCSDTYILTRTWTGTDNCGNTASQTQIITAEDTTEPILSGIPADITVECDAIPTAASPMATDNCDTNVEIVFNEAQTDGDCSDTYILTRTWTATDNCGNIVSQTQVITIEDSTEPILSGIPADITVECDAVPTAASPTATDNCDTNVEIAFNEAQTDGDCSDTYVLTRTWTATDNCGNTASQTQIITIEDSTEPILSGIPTDITIECDAIPTAASPMATDNCDTNVEIVFNEAQTDGDCSDTYILSRTWTATDNCGNIVSQTQVITIEDSTEPILSGIPADITVECDAVPTAASPTATDNCDTNVEITFNETQTDGDCSDTYILNRTWTAIDNCGNTASQTQIITVEDLTEPILSGIPTDITIECDAIPTAASPTATDNCDTNVEIAFNEIQTDGDCSDTYILSRTWTATDNCGNIVSQTQVITIEDSTEPILSGIPADITVECDAVPTAASPTATDNCDTNVEITFNETQTDGDCSDTYILNRTWTAIDNCGNTASQTQIITVEDLTEPILSGIPTDITIECDAIPTAASPTATDNCDTNVEIAFNEIQTDGDCSDTYVLTRTWTATDNCGNTASQTQIITAEDTTDPILSGIPADITVECDAIPAAVSPTATDNCDTNVEIAFNEAQTDGDCSDTYVLTRTWTATDNCGNTASQTQIITIEDSTEPILSGIPADITVECDAVPTAASPTATDNCDIDVEIAFNETQTDGDCSDTYVLTRTWTATDNCGNTASQTQIITIEDLTEPILSGIPTDITIECDAIPAAASPTATDNCDTNVEIAFNETQTDGDCSDTYVLTRTWTATDNCGNTASQTQIITIEDLTEPILSGIPTDITIECDAIPAAASPTATDNCDTNVEIAFNEAQTDGDCSDTYILTRTWTATDNCGNTASQTQIITIEDLTEPILSGIPADITVECDAVPAAASPTATDNCDTNVEIVFNETQTDGDCSDTYVLTRIWTATDNCGNTVSQTQIITAEDSTDPILSGVPANITVECDAVPGASMLSATDNCDTEVEIIYTENRIDGPCEDTYTLIRQWTAVDNCGNQDIQIQKIEIEDTTAPALSGVPANVNAACDDIPEIPQIDVAITATDNCDIDVLITFNEIITPGDCSDSYIITRTWTAEDNCGNTSESTQIITVGDNTAPVLSGVPANVTVDCGNIPAPANPVANDSCDDNVEISFNEAVVPGNCQDSYTVIRSWTAIDNCGNTEEVQQIISVFDTTGPVLIGAPADITVECDDLPAPPVIGIDILATDNCDTNVEIGLFENIVPGPCTDAYQLVRSWFATDNCGNLAEASQIITVQDTTDPELLGVPTDITLNPGEPIPDPANVLATDNCDDNVEVVFTESEETVGCITTITRTWEAIDNCGNSVEESQQIIGIDILNVVITPENTLICAGENIVFSSNQTDPAFTYVWTSTGGNFDDPASINPVYTNSTPGTYDITLSVSSGMGCEGFASTTVTVFDEPVASAASNSPVCEGANILLFASGGNAYFWSGPNGYTSSDQNPIIENASISDAGIYSVMVMLGDCGNEAVVEVIVTEGITADFNVVDVDCDTTGAINIGAIGGSGIYTYDWADLPGNNDPEDRDGLAPGSYSVTIYDAGGCVFEIEEIIVGDNCGCTAFAGGIDIDADLACLENGTASILAFSNGTAVVPPGYTTVYLLSSGFDLSIIDLNTIPEFEVSETGVFAVHPFVYNPATFDINLIQFSSTTIFDIHFLLQQGGGTICGSLNIPGISITVTEAIATIDSTGPAGCDVCNGTASLSPDNYLYQWSDGGNGPERNNLCAGNYEITATDTNTGCTDILTLIIEEDCDCIDPLVENIQVFDADCGVANGAVNITMEGDESEYAYNWWPNIGSASSIGNNRAELISGIYSITITDLDMPDCITIIEIAVGNTEGPQNLDITTTDASCNQSNGSATILPDTYTYIWIFDQLQSNSRDDLSPGTYQVVVIDPLVPDCPEFITIEIGEDNPLQAEAQIIDPPTCNASDGVVKINVIGNTGLPNFSWSDNAALNTEFRTNLPVGEYAVTVTDDETGCSIVVDFYLAGGSGEVTIEIANEPSLLCAEDAFGLVDYTLTFSQDFELPATEIIQDANGNTVSNGQLGAGTYCILVSDANGCLGGQACFEVSEPEDLTADISIENADCQQGGFIDVDISGGVGAYNYNWLDLPGIDDPQDREDLAAGNYSVTVIDENGCKLILNDLLVEDDCFGCTATSGGITADANPACLQNGSALISATPDGTSVVPAGYVTIYLLSTGAGLTIIDISGNPEFTVTATGSYSIHPFVFNPATFDLSTIIFGSANIFDVHFLLQQGGGTICGGLNIPGAFVFVTEISANIENITPDECAACIGTVTLSPSTYLYQWSDGGNGPGRTNLCDGIYEVTATDFSTGCTDLITVIVGDLCDPVCPNPDTIYTLLSIFTEVTECVEFEDCFAASETNYILLDGNTSGNSAFGNWTLDNEGCLTYTSAGIAGNFADTICVVAEYAGLLDTTCIIVSIIDQPLNTPEIDTIYLTTLEETPIDTCLALDELNGNFASNDLYYAPVNGTGFLELDPDEPCLSFTPNPGESGDFIDTLGVIICDDLGFCDTTIVIVSVLPQGFCQNVYSGADTLTLDDCAAMAPVCLDIPLQEVLNYTVSDNGLPYSDGYLACDFDSLVTYLAFGFSDGQSYALDWTVNGTVLSISNFNSLQELVDTMNVLDPDADWELNGILIAGGDFSNVYGNMVVSFNGTIITTATPVIQIIPTGISIQLDTGYHEVILTDTITGCIDTFEVTINCLPITGMSTDTILTIFEGMTDTLCLEVSGLTTITSITNLCPDDSDGNVVFELIPGTACFEYSGEILGLDTFCIEVCDSTLNICDTTNIIIQVLPVPDTIETGILLGFSDTLCLDTSLFANDLGVFFNYCFTAAGPFIEYELDEENYCVYYTGIDVGTDTLCMVLCDVMGFCDTTVLIVNVNPLTTDTIFTSIVAGETDTICLDTSELTGNIESISNVCEGLSGTYVDFNLLADWCISYEALIPDGTDTACLVICDEFGFCDTTILITTVIENPLIEPPIAVDDDTTALAGMPTEIPILANDTLNGSLIDIGIIDGPENGTVVINPDFTATYLPDPDFCGELDSFTYYISTIGGSDTATVYIDVLCQDLTVFNAMSPNGDGINDYFAIQGIEAFPENSVSIFNRWGNQVFEKENYSNDDPWFGTWKNRNLPDGTYFYLIEAKNAEGKVVKLNGYLQIHR